MATILIAVGDTDVRDLIRMYFDLHDHHALVEIDLAGTWSRLIAGGVDLLVIDKPPAAVPQLSLMARCREDLCLAALPILVIGAPRPEHEPEAVLLTAHMQFLPMPFTMKQLARSAAVLINAPVHGALAQAHLHTHPPALSA